MNGTQYYNALSRLWQQLDTFEEHGRECPGDARRYKRIVENKRIKFLVGLSKNLDEVRGRVLAIKPLPSIREVFSKVRKEELRKRVMLGDVPSLNSPENSSALAAKGNQGNGSKMKKGRPWCEHCRRPGHTRETCWKIHGKPHDWKPAKYGVEKESWECSCY